MIFYNYWIRVQETRQGDITVFTMRDNGKWDSNENVADYNRRVCVANYKPRNQEEVSEWEVIDSGLTSKEFPDQIELCGYISENDLTFKVGGEWLEGKLLPFVGNKARITINFLPDV